MRFHTMLWYGLAFVVPFGLTAEVIYARFGLLPTHSFQIEPGTGHRPLRSGPEEEMEAISDDGNRVTTATIQYSASGLYYAFSDWNERDTRSGAIVSSDNHNGWSILLPDGRRTPHGRSMHGDDNYLLDSEKQQCLVGLPGESAAFSKNGQWLATIDDDRVVRVWSLPIWHSWVRVFAFSFAVALASCGLFARIRRLNQSRSNVIS